MGLCASSSAGAAAATTALVLLPTGELREYPRAATAARALEDAAAGCGGEAEAEKAGPSSWFLCDADGVGFDGPVTAVRGGEALRPGQIYFVLPAETRRRGMRGEEVAALAVKASAALAAAAGTNGRSRRRGAVVAPLVFSPPTEEEEEERMAVKTVPVATTRRHWRRPRSVSRR
ncbi:hypothetical protein PR202_gb12135 [Eleusine coracana subsp. coracana]|uniref:Uncharacterized protein n=1 Tax=Eleusine coracana subsp. coracana TaxID=191504 RepID=A0AAV5EPN4_ELECO|nr:hypothetical protein QOZ80_7BG0585330 [Eleusine coracana subsp. coracana]GJN24397.1 hypothetical protein PR202_gb12135 [Eleusine coracana subsp. coracana]